MKENNSISLKDFKLLHDRIIFFSKKDSNIQENNKLIVVFAFTFSDFKFIKELEVIIKEKFHPDSFSFEIETSEEEISPFSCIITKTFFNEMILNKETEEFILTLKETYGNQVKILQNSILKQSIFKFFIPKSITSNNWNMEEIKIRKMGRDYYIYSENFPFKSLISLIPFNLNIETEVFDLLKRIYNILTSMGREGIIILNHILKSTEYFTSLNFYSLKHSVEDFKSVMNTSIKNLVVNKNVFKLSTISDLVLRKYYIKKYSLKFNFIKPITNDKIYSNNESSKKYSKNPINVPYSKPFFNKTNEESIQSEQIINTESQIIEDSIILKMLFPKTEMPNNYFNKKLNISLQIISELNENCLKTLMLLYQNDFSRIILYFQNQNEYNLIKQEIKKIGNIKKTIITNKKVELEKIVKYLIKNPKIKEEISLSN